MAAFNPAMLVPASNVDAFAKSAAGRTTKQVALDNISKQIELMADAKIEGRRTFEIAGDKAKFTIRVNNTALVLMTVKDGDKTAEVREIAVPAANLKDAFEHFGKLIDKGDYDKALAEIEKARVARTDKMRATRAAKPKAEKKSA